MNVRLFRGPRESLKHFRAVCVAISLLAIRMLVTIVYALTDLVEATYMRSIALWRVYARWWRSTELAAISPMRWDVYHNYTTAAAETKEAMEVYDISMLEPRRRINILTCSGLALTNQLCGHIPKLKFCTFPILNLLLTRVICPGLHKFNQLCGHRIRSLYCKRVYFTLFGVLVHVHTRMLIRRAVHT